MIPEATTFTTDRGIRVLRTVEDIAVEGAIDQIIDALDTRRGALFASSYEYPGRYTRWDVGFVDPLIELACRGREVSVTALNRRGRQLLPVLADVLTEVPDLASPELRGERLGSFSVEVTKHVDAATPEYNRVGVHPAHIVPARWQIA